MKKLTFEIQFEIGQIVFIKTDPDQLIRIVIGYEIRPSNVVYQVQSGTHISEHYGFELADTVNILRN